MNAGRGLWALLGLLALLCTGLILIFQLRVGTGDLYPAYSSFRADPVGLRLLHDGLAALPELRVERNLEAYRYLDPVPQRCLILAGFTPQQFDLMPVETANALDASVRGGSRLVIAFSRQTHEGKPKLATHSPAAPNPSGSKGEHKAMEEKRVPEAVEGLRSMSGLATKLWGVELWLRGIVDRGQGALRKVENIPGIPASLPWKTALYFKPTPGAPWRVLMTHGSVPCLMELRHGKGSIVLVSDGFFMSNEALSEKAHPEFLSWLIGPTTRVLFDERHLGLVEDTGIAALALRYGLAPAAVLLLLLALLYIWRCSSRFVPPPEEAGHLALEFHPTAGLEALLRRSLPPARVFQACLEEWRKTASAPDLARLASLPSASPVASYNTALRALRRGKTPR